MCWRVPFLHRTTDRLFFCSVEKPSEREQDILCICPRKKVIKNRTMQECTSFVRTFYLWFLFSRKLRMRVCVYICVCAYMCVFLTRVIFFLEVQTGRFHKGLLPYFTLQWKEKKFQSEIHEKTTFSSWDKLDFVLYALLSFCPCDWFILSLFFFCLFLRRDLPSERIAQNKEVKVGVFAHDKWKKDKLLGEATVDIKSLLYNGSHCPLSSQRYWTL